MTRTARLEELGLPFHVIAQGIDRCAIFVDNHDRLAFVLRAIRVFGEMGIQVLAWALMDNHLHLVLRSAEGRLGKAMQRLLGPHAQRFNRRQGRVGRLFRDRFQSRPVEDDSDLLNLIGYVLLNPVRGGIVQDVEELSSYPWSGLAELLAEPKGRERLIDRAAVAALFAVHSDSPLDELLEMLWSQLARDADGTAVKPFLPTGSAALSDRERKDLELQSTQALRLRNDRMERVLKRRDGIAAIRKRLEHRGWTLNRVVERAAAICGVSAHRLRVGRRSRAQSRARGLVAYFAGMYLACSDAEIARAVGIARQSVTTARRRGIAHVDRDALCWATFFEVPEEVTEAKSCST